MSVMINQEMSALFFRIEPRLRAVYHQEPISNESRQDAIAAVAEWRQIEGCVEALNCDAVKCYFAKPLKWVIHAGHETLCRMLCRQSDGGNPFEPPNGGPSGDALDSPLRQPGNFHNP